MYALIHALQCAHGGNLCRPLNATREPLTAAEPGSESFCSPAVRAVPSASDFLRRAYRTEIA